jgi:hypothetical protein
MSTNPLKNYFRKAAIAIRLPSKGQGYKEGSIDLTETGEVSIYPMTALDDINIRTPDNVVNGKAVVGLIASCVPAIKDPWDIPNIDLDAIILGIKVATNGKTTNVETECPQCEKVNTHEIDVLKMIESISVGSYDDMLEVNGLMIKFRPLSYKQIISTNEKQAEVQKKIMAIEAITDDEKRSIASSEVVRDLNAIALDIVSETIEYVRTPNEVVTEQEFIKEFLKNCDKESFESIRTKNISLRESAQIKPVKLHCKHCLTEYNFSLDVDVSSI